MEPVSDGDQQQMYASKCVVPHQGRGSLRHKYQTQVQVQS